jgi:uncharacterized Zn finger protein (UPF0148 family)
MEIRGNRRCRSCGTEWSYYETGAVACPSCGSFTSVGTDDERRQHTDTPSTLQLEAFADRIADEPLDQYAADLQSTLRSYSRKRGFINGGELRDLDDTYLAARELIHVTDILRRSQSPTEAELLYLVAVFNSLSADQATETPLTSVQTHESIPAQTPESTPTVEWPPQEGVPPSLEAARGLAVTESCEAYRRDLRTWLEETPDTEAIRTLGLLREQCKRAAALQGEIDPAHAADLLASAREIGRFLREDDSDALASARDRLDQL